MSRSNSWLTAKFALPMALAWATAVSSLAWAEPSDRDMPSDPAAAGAIHVCSSCHGLTGRSISPTFPRLAGQQKDYIKNQLVAFRDKTRADPHAKTYMWGIANKLDDATIDRVATYFSAQTPVAGKPGDPAAIARGKVLFEEGAPEREIPACFACHGDHAEGNEGIPRLAGQHRAYLESQLGHFQTKARENEVMDENAKNLTAAEIHDLAAFFAAQ